MRIYHQPVELIVKVPAITSKSKGLTSPASLKKQLKEAGITVTDIRQPRTKIKKTLSKKSIPASEETAYLKTSIKDSEQNPWDVAHLSYKALNLRTAFVEPDFLQEFVTDRNIDVPYKKVNGTAAHGSDIGYDPDWKPKQNIIWHLDDAFSQLKSARDKVMDLKHVIRIGHLDTGIDKNHSVLAGAIKNNPLQRNFVEGENINNAQDPFIDGGLRNPGHGLATMAILAGTKIKLATDNGTFHDYLGGAPFADVVACRIASSVVLMKTSAFAEALIYLTELTRNGTPVHVVSMSMGGAPAKSWADAVNSAYDAGIVVVTAAGNNFNGLPTKHVVYPARFKRVIAACGVTYEYKPYSHNKLGEMQGCYGPDRHMSKALAAFTPNTPWAQAHSGKISFSGAGTSSATPQIAAAAAIYYRKNYNALQALQPWQRVEAVRNALFSSARKTVNGNGNYRAVFGNGIVQALAALNVAVAPGPKTPPDSVPIFPILSTLFKAKPVYSPKIEMFNTELAQLTYYYPELESMLGDGNSEFVDISKKQWDDFKDAVIEHRESSLALKEYLIQTQTANKVKLIPAVPKKTNTKRSKKSSRKK